MDTNSVQDEKIEPSFKLPKRPKRKITKPGEPAYVAPIPKIGSIPPVPPISPGITPSISVSPERPKLPPFVGSFLLGKPVDEFGDIVDDKTGQVLARAGGDLPSIVGRQVSNKQGDILGDNGELLGYVADIEIERKGSPGGSGSGSPGSPQPRSLFEIMSRSNAPLMVDHLGNILDTKGNVVGKFLDNNNPDHRRIKEEMEAKESEKKSPPKEEKEADDDDVEGEKGKNKQQPEPTQQPAPAPPEESEEGESSQERKPRRTEEERRANAQAWRKENPGESPSDIFLDVKSTTEGIQLTIRIPTVFGGQQVRPNISFS
ncbi:hypothetical protein QBC37DRAFT_290659 [Rhypophila decipiens]|uniref:Uncharacterized protein n=1 Tax=Rhypophila decipiens TaxID=261697 RepID=A0AAN6Y2Z6_9PEZI|nr:hypothetical protein QBC37DRAFT_290659 [Rhypophila decipiens]